MASRLDIELEKMIKIFTFNTINECDCTHDGIYFSSKKQKVVSMVSSQTTAKATHVINPRTIGVKMGITCILIAYL